MLFVDFFLFEFQVIVPSTGKRALDMMCGEWGASRCSPKKWFEFMGDAEGNLYVPFQITYITDPIVGYTPLSPVVVPCNQAINVSFERKRDLRFRFSKIWQLYRTYGAVRKCRLFHAVPYVMRWRNDLYSVCFTNFQNKTLPCACVDCEESCPKPAPPPPAQKAFTIFDLDGYKVCMAVLFIVLSTLFLIGVCLYPSKSIDDSEYMKNW